MCVNHWQSSHPVSSTWLQLCSTVAHGRSHQEHALEIHQVFRLAIICAQIFSGLLASVYEAPKRSQSCTSSLNCHCFETGRHALINRSAICPYCCSRRRAGLAETLQYKTLSNLAGTMDYDPDYTLSASYANCSTSCRLVIVIAVLAFLLSTGVGFLLYYRLTSARPQNQSRYGRHSRLQSFDGIPSASPNSIRSSRSTY